jgi:hypothetical protein
MDLVQQGTTATDAGTRSRFLTTLVIAAAVAAVVAAGIFAVATGSARTPAPVAELSAEQIVIRGEVQDRLAAPIGLSAEQIVIRGEVQDRRAAPVGLSAEQIVIRAEVADRWGK